MWLYLFDRLRFSYYLYYLENIFDSLKFYDELKAADVPDKQATAQAEALRKAFAAYDASKMETLAAKGDIQNVRLEIEKVRSEMQQLKYGMLKWQFGIAAALAAIMAKGFGRLGF